MRNTKKKGFWKPVALGFGVVYVLTMGLATWLVKEKFTEDYDRRFQEAASYVMGRISDKEFAMEEEGWGSEDSRRHFYQTEANDCLWRIGSDELQISVMTGRGICWRGPGMRWAEAMWFMREARYGNWFPTGWKIICLPGRWRSWQAIYGRKPV